MAIQTEPFPELVSIRGVVYPLGLKRRHLLVAGPPRSGKSTLVQALGGWPEEGYLDLGVKNWWLNRVLSFRPREVHFGFPFVGFTESHAVFDKEWTANPTPIDVARIRLPPPKRFFYQKEWRRYFVFDILIPPPADLFRVGLGRARRGSHPVDRDLTQDIVERQYAVYVELAQLLDRAGFQVMVRCAYGGPPLKLLNAADDAAASSVGASSSARLSASSAPGDAP